MFARTPNAPHSLQIVFVRPMTAAFAAGQIAGPLSVRAIGSGRWAGWNALEWTGAAATLLLILSALFTFRRDVNLWLPAPMRLRSGRTARY